MDLLAEIREIADGSFEKLLCTIAEVSLYKSLNERVRFLFIYHPLIFILSEGIKPTIVLVPHTCHFFLSNIVSTR